MGDGWTRHVSWFVQAWPILRSRTLRRSSRRTDLPDTSCSFLLPFPSNPRADGSHTDRIQSPWMVNPDDDQPATCPGATEDDVVVSCWIVSFVAIGISKY